MSLPKIICIVGSTASGKTDMAIALAKKYNGEIISADSRQIYRGMDIGTAKVKGQWQKRGKESVFFAQGIPHYGIDLVDPDEPFTVVDFKTYAIARIGDIQERQHVPFLVGGTGLYVQAVVDNFSIPHVSPHLALRKKIEALVQEKGLHAVYVELLKLDPDAADFVAPSNARRIIRALEVSLATGKPFSEQKKKGKRLFSVLHIALDVPRAIIYDRINARIDAQMRSGFVEEVRGLLQRYPSTLPSFSGIGYAPVAAALCGDITMEKAIAVMQQRTRHYARRQLTWFRRDARIHWVHTEKESDDLVKKFLK